MKTAATAITTTAPDPPTLPAIAFQTFKVLTKEQTRSIYLLARYSKLEMRTDPQDNQLDERAKLKEQR